MGSPTTTISSVSSDITSGTLTIGQTLLITLTFNNATSADVNKNITVTGSPLLSLNNGATATYVSGSGSKNIVFRYVVTSGVGSTVADLNAASSNPIVLNGGTIKDSGSKGDGSTAVLSTSNTFGATPQTLGTTASVACFLRGTTMSTMNGDVAVEDLAIGDSITTAEDGEKAVKWIGRTTYEAGTAEAMGYIRPVVIRAGAMGDSLPTRDLRVSPQHALYIDGVLVPAVGLVNGVSILRDNSAEAIEYFHVELDEHNVILAEGVASETFIDMDSRAMFDNASEFDRLYGDTVAPQMEFAPRVEEGFLLAAMRKRYALLAGIPVPSPDACGTLQGNVEQIIQGTLVGWAFDIDHPDHSVEVEAVVDGEVVGRAIANRYRPDLYVAGLGHGNCCFTMAMPPSVTSIADVLVRRVADGRVIVPHVSQPANA
jgi:hypothetical protein